MVDFNQLNSLPEDKLVEFLANEGFQRTESQGNNKDVAYEQFMEELRENVSRELALKVGQRMLAMKIKQIDSRPGR